MSAITDFLAGSGPDSNGMLIHEVWANDDDWWEGCHNHVQWVFPTTEPSQYNPNAPLLTQDDIAIIRGDREIQDRIKYSFYRFLRFLGLKVFLGRIIPTSQFIDKSEVWTGFNHNWLRITRVLTCLKLAGLDEEAAMFHTCLTKISWLALIPEDTTAFWFDATLGDKV